MKVWYKSKYTSGEGPDECAYSFNIRYLNNMETRAADGNFVACSFCMLNNCTDFFRMMLFYFK